MEEVCSLVRRLLCRSQELKAKREELSVSSAGQEAEVPDTHEALRKQVRNRKRLRNSPTGRESNFCLLRSAESRQRRVTWPSVKETSRWLERPRGWV